MHDVNGIMCVGIWEEVLRRVAGCGVLYVEWSGVVLTMSYMFVCLSVLHSTL